MLVVNLTRPRCRLLLASAGWVERAGRAGAVATLVLDTAPRSVDTVEYFVTVSMYKIVTDDMHCSRSWRVSSPPASPGPGSWVRATVAQLLQLRRGAAGQLVVVLRRADWAPHSALLATRGRRVTLSAEMLRQGGELGTGLGWVKTTSRPLPGQYPSSPPPWPVPRSWCRSCSAQLTQRSP